MNTKNTARKGFTTVELVIVIAVIAILATVLIPTFSNLIEKANLSSDKQNVRNMNICLTTEIASQIKANKPEDFGTVKELLKEYGYGKESNFVPKSKGFSYRWFIDDRGDNDKSNDMSIIVLVNDKNEVVFPEEYTHITNAGNVRKYFDLSLPAAVVIPNGETTVGTAYGLFTGLTVEEQLTLATSYTFIPANSEDRGYYDWYADFYISFIGENGSAPDYNRLRAIEFMGYYNGWSKDYGKDVKDDGKEVWLRIAVNDRLIAKIKSNPDKELPLIGTIEDMQLLYSWVLANTVRDKIIHEDASDDNTHSEFKCGVIDPVGGDDAGITMIVEFRLTNTSNTEDIKVIGTYSYTFQ
mgnify:CR=1 FL=1